MKYYIEHLPEGLKSWLDAISFGALLGSLASLLPTIASLLTVIWTAMRIYESMLAVRQMKAKETEDGR